MRKGQVLIVVLMVLAIGITVAMAISSRSVTEISVSTTQDESSRALEAAQIGLERYMGEVPFDDTSVITHGSGDVSEMNARYVVPTANIEGGETWYLYPVQLVAGDVATIGLPPGDATNTYTGVKICWCNSASGACAVSPKIEATFYYHNTTGGQFTKTKPYGPASTNYKNFVLPTTTGSINCGTGMNFKYYVNIGFADDTGQNIKMPWTFGGTPGLRMDFVRIRMLDNGNTGVDVAAQLLNPSGAGAEFPPQSEIVSSIGTSGDTVQKVKAVIMNDDLPAVFDAAIFSGANISK